MLVLELDSENGQTNCTKKCNTHSANYIKRYSMHGLFLRRMCMHAALVMHMPTPKTIPATAILGLSRVGLSRDVALPFGGYNYTFVRDT